MNTNIRSATPADLDPVNQVIHAAVMTWNLPERVKRLSMSSYYYSELDLNHLHIFVAEDDKQNILGVAAWEEADSKDAPMGQSALLLHGIYVEPEYFHQGIGHQLFSAAEHAAKQHQYDGLLVKAQEDANGFFISQGMSKLSVEDTARHYANRFWKPTK
jgi:predicted N-acetyltransferase YhbS